MVEILWHGRGGQGAFTAARLLGAAGAAADGHYALAFPSFGPERRGAPMRAFTKLAQAPIGDRSAIAQADYVVYLDDTLLAAGWETEVKPGGCVLVNSAFSADELVARVGRQTDVRMLALDANEISRRLLGRIIPNTVFLGALAALDVVSVAEVKEAIYAYMAPKLHEKNCAVVDAAVQAVEQALEQAALEQAGDEARPGVQAEAACADVTGGAVAAADVGETGGAVAAAGDADSPTASNGDVQQKATSSAPATRPACVIPCLRTAPELHHESYARNTCFEAGHLVSKNAGWRNMRPVIDQEKCTGCLQCYLQCPDGTVYRTAADTQNRSVEPQGVVEIDYDFCKGCGICARACPVDAIAMLPESEVTAQ